MAKHMREQGFSTSKIQAEVMKVLRADDNYRNVVAENTKAYKAEIQKKIEETVKKAEAQGNKLIAQAGNMAWNNDLSMWQQAGVDLKKPNSLNQLIMAFQMQTLNELRNLTRSTGFKDTVFGTTGVMTAYQKELDRALLKVVTGTFSFDQAVNDCIKRLAQSGLRSIDYANGRSYQLDTAVRMAVRTATSQLAGKITESNLKQTGVDLVITSQHMGSRPEHVPWQNKVYSYSGKSKKYPDFFKETGYGTAGGLKGVNCTHNFYPFWEGISVKPDDIKEPKPKIVNGRSYTYYQATQRQRAMERRIRATKREVEAQRAIGGSTTELQASLRKQHADYYEFSKAVGIRPKDNRLVVISGSSDVKKTKVYQKSVRYTEIKSTGALNNKNDPLGRKRARHAEQYYQELRNRKPGYVINRLVQNTGISQKAAKNIYEHVFINEHIFRDGSKKRFDSDYDMAESFRRILEGKNIKPHDIIMIKHENLELNLMRKYNMVYEDAHELTETKYNYAKSLVKFLEEMGD